MKKILSLFRKKSSSYVSIDDFMNTMLETFDYSQTVNRGHYCLWVKFYCPQCNDDRYHLYGHTSIKNQEGYYCIGCGTYMEDYGARYSWEEEVTEAYCNLQKAKAKAFQLSESRYLDGTSRMWERVDELEQKAKRKHVEQYDWEDVTDLLSEGEAKELYELYKRLGVRV